MSDLTAADVTVSVQVTGTSPTQPLPRTGSSTDVLVVVALVLIAAGVVVRVLAARILLRGIRMRRTYLAAGLVALAMVGALGTPALGGEVTVGLSNPGGSRTVYVENLAGQPLTALDFGTTRSQPFRVRVVDQTMDRANFTVSATMTNLYVDSAGTIDYSKKIASANLATGNTVDPLNVLKVSASVQPLVDTVSTITDLTVCNTLGLVTSLVGGVQACQVNTTGLSGQLQSAVPVTVNLADLTNLPLLPQAAEVGAFDAPTYSGVGANDPNKPASYTPTPRRVLAGSVISTSAVLTALKGALDSDPRSELVSDNTIVNGLSAAVANWELLTTTQVQAVLDGTVATVQDLAPSQVTAQAGTYLSFPVLNVAVPSTAPKGNYKGTLVVTSLQS